MRTGTREGQVRSGDRHEKYDRHHVDDPRRWVLDWANERKIAALSDEFAELQPALVAATNELSGPSTLSGTPCRTDSKPSPASRSTVPGLASTSRKRKRGPRPTMPNGSGCSPGSPLGGWRRHHSRP